MSDKNDKLKKNMELKQALEDLVTDSDNLEVDKGEEISNIRDNSPQLYTDFNKLSSNAKEEAKKIVGSIIKFYLDLDLINKDEYVNKKRQLQEMTVASTMFNLQTSEYLCIKLLEEIDAGNANLKTFEVCSKIQETMMKIVEVQSNSINKLEDQWKKYRTDSEEIKLYNLPQCDSQDEGQDLRIKGSRKLVELAQKISEEKGINKSDPHDITVDPREAHYKDSLKTEEDPNNKIDDELFN